MNSYEKLVKILTKGKNADGIKRGVVTGNSSIQVEELKLESDDYLLPCYLKYGYMSEGKFVPPLQNGDNVLLYRMSDELYIVLERLVSQ